MLPCLLLLGKKGDAWKTEVTPQDQTAVKDRDGGLDTVL